MITQPSPPADGLFDWTDGVPYFRGVRVYRQTVCVAGRSFEMVALKDAAELLDNPVFAKEFIEADRAPYGLELWPVASVLAEHILQGEAGEGRAALDLGCGLGLTAMAATLRDWRVLAADHDPGALQFAEYNASANGVNVDAFELFDWHKPREDRKFARVFGADILYQRTDQVPILRCLEAVLATDGVAWLADPNRRSVNEFAELASEHGWHVEMASETAKNRVGRVIEGRIFILKRRSPE